MITIFNRKELTLTYDMAIQAKIRAILSANHIDYKINYISEHQQKSDGIQVLCEKG